MSEEVVRLLGLGVLILLFLFLFRVLRAIWASVDAAGGNPSRLRAAGTQTHRSGGSGTQRQLGWRTLAWWRSARFGGSLAAPAPMSVVIRSPLRAQGERYSLGDEFTIGRSDDCDLVIDDSYASQSHARLYRSDAQVLLEDLGSTNGTYLNRQRVSSPAAVRLGDFVQVGSTTFEVST